MPKPLQKESYRFETEHLQMPLIIDAGYNIFQKADFLEWHSHDGFELTFVTKGNVCWELADGSTHHLDIGQASLVLPNMSHQGLHGVTSPCEMAWITFMPDKNATMHTPITPNEMQSLKEMFFHCGNCVVDTTPMMLSLLDELKKLFVNKDTFRNSTLSGINQRALLFQILIHAACCFDLSLLPNEPSDFTIASSYIKSRFTEPLSVREIAQQIGKKETYVYNLFKTQTGLTPNEYIQRLRLHYAAEQLQKTQLTITEITFAAGFSSSQYFAKVFSRYMGRSPSAFRAEK